LIVSDTASEAHHTTGKGYAISEPEMKISRDQFRQQFGMRETGEAEYVMACHDWM